MNKSNRLILALFITLLPGAATTSQAVIISFTGLSDTATPIPGGTGNFLNFPGAPSINLGNVAFVGTGSDGKAGVYVLTPPDPIMPVANTSTAIPGAAGNFARFGAVAIDPGIMVFEGFDASLRKGLYSDLGGTLSKVITEGDTLGDKTVSSLRFQRTGFSDGQVAFVAEFSDASQGVFLATLSQAPCPQSQGHWKNNPALWPATSVTLGSQTYSKTGLLAILKNPTSSDASIILARQLIAAKLNVANGSDPTPVSSTINDADSLLGGITGKLPYKIKTNSATGKAMVNGATVLNNYNNNQLTPGCTP